MKGPSAAAVKIESPGERRSRMRWGLAATLVFVLALAVRLAVVADLAALPTQVALIEDSRAYDAVARELLANGWLPERAFYQAPLYPYIIAACYRWLGDTPMTVRLVQALAGALAALVLAACGRELGGVRVGLLTGLLAAGFAPFLFYTPLLLKPTFLVLFESLFLLAVLSLGRARSPWLISGAGASLGLAVLMRGNLLLLLPFLFVWWVVHWARRRRAGDSCGAGKMLSELALLAAGFGVAVLPVSLVNYAASGELILSSSQSGSNFYIGNHLGASGIYEPLMPGRQSPEFEQEDARRVAAGIVERETGEPVDSTTIRPTEVSRALWRQSGREISADPAAWLRLLGRKLILFWNRYEIPDAESFDVYRLESGWLRWNPLLFGVVAPLGLLGLWINTRETRDLFLLFMVAGSTVSVVLFYVFGRYRLPVVPFLLPLAGLAVTWLLSQERWRTPQRLRAGLTVLAVGTAIVWWPIVSPDFRALQLGIAHHNLGVAASRLAKESLGTDPAESARWIESARDHLARAGAADPHFLPTRVEMAVLALRAGALAQAKGNLIGAREQLLIAERMLEEIAGSAENSPYAEVAAEARAQLWPDVWRALAVADLALAEARLAAGDTAGGLTLLREASQRVDLLRPVDPAAAAGLADRIAELERRAEAVT